MKALLKTTLLLLIVSAVFAGCGFKRNPGPRFGEYEGVGVEIYGRAYGIFAVISVVRGSPADKAGIIGGDIILKINDEETKNLTFEQVVNKISGVAGSKVYLLIERNKQLHEFSIVRAAYRAREDNLIK